MWYAIIAIIFLTIGFLVGRFSLPYDGNVFIDTRDTERLAYKFCIDRFDIHRKYLILRIVVIKGPNAKNSSITVEAKTKKED